MSQVMLIEDDPTLSNLLKTLLEMEGFSVQVARTGSETEITRLTENENPDVILMDVYLRNMNGLDLVRGFRQRPRLAKTRVVMVSGTDMGEQCLAAGADQFVMKPFMPEELIRAVRNHAASD